MSSWETLCSLKCLPPAGLTSGSLTPWLLWSIWKARNKFVFEGHSASPEDTLSAAIVLAREWNTEVKKEPPTGLRHLPAPVQTHPEATVIRSDVAWAAGSNNAGLGWVLLSHSGNRSFKVPLKCVASPLVAEGLALREAVRSCATLGLKYVTFESDSLSLIKAVKFEVTITELYSVIADITSYVSAFEFVSFSWISRENNVLADCVVKEALNVSETLRVGDAFIAPN